MHQGADDELNGLGGDDGDGGEVGGDAVAGAEKRRSCELKTRKEEEVEFFSFFFGDDVDRNGQKSIQAHRLYRRVRERAVP